MPLGDEALTQLAGAERLVNLDLTATGAGDATVAGLAALPCLERLILDDTSVTSAGVVALADSSVKEISLRGCRIDGGTLRVLASMPGLNILSLSMGADWNGLEGLTEIVELQAMAPVSLPASLPQRLHRLRLHGTIGPKLLAELAMLPALEQVAVRAGADVFASITNGGFMSLRTLVAEAANLDDLSLDRIGHLPAIEALFISYNPVAESVARLDAPFLHTLELRGAAGVNDTVVPALARLPRLHCLDLPGTAVSAAGIATLVSSAANLQSLALDAKQLDSASIAAIAAAPTLIELYLYGSGIDNTVVARLSPLLRLRELNLIGTSLTDDVVPSLAALTSLRVVRIGNELSAAAIASLRAMRPDIRVIGVAVSSDLKMNWKRR